MPSMNAKPGEIWLADLGLAAKTRPVLIISRHDPEAPRALLIYVPLTTQHRGSRYEAGLWGQACRTVGSGMSIDLLQQEYRRSRK